MRKRSRVSLPVRPIIVDFDSFVAVTVTLAMAAQLHETAVAIDLAGNEAGRHEVDGWSKHISLSSPTWYALWLRVGHEANSISAL